MIMEKPMEITIKYPGPVPEGFQKVAALVAKIHPLWCQHSGMSLSSFVITLCTKAR